MGGSYILIILLLLMAYVYYSYRVKRKKNLDKPYDLKNAENMYLEIMRLYEKFQGENDPVIRKKLFTEVERLLIDYQKKYPQSHYKNDLFQLRNALREILHKKD